MNRHSRRSDWRWHGPDQPLTAEQRQRVRVGMILCGVERFLDPPPTDEELAMAQVVVDAEHKEAVRRSREASVAICPWCWSMTCTAKRDKLGFDKFVCGTCACEFGTTGMYKGGQGYRPQIHVSIGRSDRSWRMELVRDAMEHMNVQAEQLPLETL